MDASDLAERILLDLKNTFKKDPLIDEFDILPVHESVQNTCPVIHIEHKIALEEWCVKHVYVYAYTKFFTWRRKPYKIDPSNLLIWTSAILLINPEIETAWNARKELMCQNVLKYEEDLRFSEVVLSRKAKSSQTFAHRKWVLLELRKSQPPLCSLQQIIDHEFVLCNRTANLYPNNYYAWCHRSWIMQELLHNCMKIACEELNRMEHWISTHVSDYSGFHYRQFLISCFYTQLESKSSSICIVHKANSNDGKSKCNFVDSDGDIINFNTILEKELTLLCSLQATYPGHETLWNHRRYILHQFNVFNTVEELGAVKETDASVEDSIQCKRHKVESHACDKSQWNILNEEKFLNECLRLAKHNTWERTLIERHIKWLQNVILWPITLPIS